MTVRIEPRSYLAATPGFAEGRDDPRKFLERCLSAIDAHEKDVLAFVHLDAAGARATADASAARWREGKQLSPIDGMPVGVKDVIETVDMPTGMGSPLFAGVRSGRDAASVKALRQAGAVILGKTVTTEFAASVPGPTRNPHDLKRTPGGSSSGSAAGAAAGFFSVGLGTQVVGSILRPAGFCGVVGFKPSLGGINRGGSHDFMSQSVQGALGASLADVWAVLIEIVNRCGGDPGWPGLAGPVAIPAAKAPRALAVLETPGWQKVSDALKADFAALVAKLVKGGVKILARKNSPAVEAVEKAIENALPLTRDINGWESIWPLNIYRDRDASKLSPEMRDRLAESEKTTPDDYRRALAARAAMRGTFAALAKEIDACLTLSAPGAAPVGLGHTGDPAFVVAGSALGVPAITLPLLAEQGLPVGAQILGFEQRDADAVAIARWVEAAARAG
jgi:Asp-tRNA(Asn)/Glu-tRNA(Gln) amidotransferase A subunit family amidase